MANEMTVTLTDADYQTLERQMANENVALRREIVVLTRVINDVRAAWARDRQMVAELEAELSALKSVPSATARRPKKDN